LSVCACDWVAKKTNRQVSLIRILLILMQNSRRQLDLRLLLEPSASCDKLEAHVGDLVAALPDDQ
jgi:hypothetical protein